MYLGYHQLPDTDTFGPWRYTARSSKAPRAPLEEIESMRTNTFKFLFDEIALLEDDLVIVETGTIRQADWAASDGHSTVKFVEVVEKRPNTEFYTIDTDPLAIQTSKDVITKKFKGIPDGVTFIESPANEFLATFNKEIDILYLDSANDADITLNEYLSAKNLLKPTSIVMVDDADRNNPRLNKWKKVVGEMIRDDWTVRMWEYQCILTRCK